MQKFSTRVLKSLKRKSRLKKSPQEETLQTYKSLLVNSLELSAREYPVILRTERDLVKLRARKDAAEKARVPGLATLSSLQAELGRMEPCSILPSSA